ncbi:MULTISPECIES: hypothetical protein [unclassified Alteromonas]|uniref:hypothetical protein n=1 Tax=unclassified Alteromonas TaxID=2614992 RepID=UPI00135A9822|nr:MULTISPECIES: hypothetical protein [unclassified Alteromonas]
MDNCVGRSIPIKKLAHSYIALLCLLSAGKAIADTQKTVDSSLWTEQVNQAQTLEQQGQRVQSVALLKKFADAGNGLAQFSFAWRTKLGSSEIAANRSLACEYFVKSAQLNIPVGAQEAGHCYRDNIITSSQSKHTQLAKRYYQIAIDNGLVASYCDIAALQQSKPTIELNQLVAQCEQVAVQGAVYAQEILVDIYANTKGINNNEKAIYWLKIAADKSAKSAYRYALTLHQSGQIKPELIRYYFESAASKGYIPAYLETAALYYNAATEEVSDDNAGALIAKAYLWSKAWQVRNPQVEVPEWVIQIGQQIPTQWKVELDQKVTEHVSLYPV